MRSLAAVTILLLVVAAAPGGASVTESGIAAQVDDPTNATSVEVFVQLETNGDARLSVTTRVPVEDEHDEAAFERLAAEFEAGGDVGYRVEPFRQVANALSTELGRPMDIENVSRSTTLVNGTGALTLSFTWTNFAQDEGAGLVLGDVFGASESPVFTALEANQRLVIAPPQGYAVDQSSVAVGGGSQLVIEGPRTLESGDVRVVYVEAAGPGTTDDTETPAENGGFPVGAAGFLGVLAVVVVALVVLRRRPDDEGEVVTEPTPPEPTPEPPEPDPDVDPDDPFADVDLDLISDEERITLLLEANRGRMKQGQIVKETMWSNAKVSQLLSKMSEDGQINKLRIGRENLISLPEVSLTDPDDEE